MIDSTNVRQIALCADLSRVCLHFHYFSRVDIQSCHHMIYNYLHFRWIALNYTKYLCNCRLLTNSFSLKVIEFFKSKLIYIFSLKFCIISWISLNLLKSFVNIFNNSIFFVSEYIIIKFPWFHSLFFCLYKIIIISTKDIIS